MHRMMSRTMKPFAVKFGLQDGERSIHHVKFGPRSSNLVPRVIRVSLCSGQIYLRHFMAASPQGITGIEAGNDLFPIDRKLTLLAFKSYGKIRELYNEIKECVAVMDGTGEPGT